MHGMITRMDLLFPANILYIKTVFIHAKIHTPANY